MARNLAPIVGAHIHALPNEPISLEEYDGESGRTPLSYRLRMVPRLDNLPMILQEADEVKISW